MIIDVRHGDSTAIMATLDADSVDAVVTDPPYGLTTVPPNSESERYD